MLMNNCGVVCLFIYIYMYICVRVCVYRAAHLLYMTFTWLSAVFFTPWYWTKCWISFTSVCGCSTTSQLAQNGNTNIYNSISTIKSMNTVLLKDGSILDFNFGTGLVVKNLRVNWHMPHTFLSLDMSRCVLDSPGQEIPWANMDLSSRQMNSL